MPKYKLGKDCKLEIGDNEVKDIKDVTLNLTKGTSDATTRAANGWRQNVPTLKEATVDFQAQVKADDTVLAVLRDAYLNDTDVPVKVSGANVFSALCIVTNFTETQPLEGSVTIDVSLSPSPGDTAPTLTAPEAAPENLSAATTTTLKTAAASKEASK